MPEGNLRHAHCAIEQRIHPRESNLTASRFPETQKAAPNRNRLSRLWTRLLLLHKRHSSYKSFSTRLKNRHIDAGSQSRCIELDSIEPSRFSFLIKKRRNLFSQYLENLHRCFPALSEREFNCRRWIEGIGIVLDQSEFLRGNGIFDFSHELLLQKFNTLRPLIAMHINPNHAIE